MMDHPKEACGVFGIYGPGEDVARITFFGLYALQHRGQESAGIATGDGERIRLFTRMGVVSQVFDEERLSTLTGHVAIGHNRYSTTGSSKAINAQPILVTGPRGEIAVGHNGNLVNTDHLRQEMIDDGFSFSASTDSEVIAKMISQAPGYDWVDAIRHSMPRFMGAYCLVILTKDELIGVRDPHGIRPLCIGRIKDAWVLASESCALDTVGAEFIREVEPGEIVAIGQDGLRSIMGQESDHPSLCVLEYIYFARPDSVINGKLLYAARQQMGRQLARQHPVDADIVIGVPDSGIPGAIGYAQESGIPFGEGIIKNRYIGRTFIQPDQRLREVGANLKYNPLPEVLKGKRVVVVEDTIVRSTTTKPIVPLLRRAGASEVHMRIHAPPICYPCHLGVDMARRSELIAARLTVPEIAEYIEADSLGYLGLDGLITAIGLPFEKFCLGCFTGDYPVPVQLDLDMDKFILEK